MASMIRGPVLWLAAVAVALAVALAVSRTPSPSSPLLLPGLAPKDVVGLTVMAPGGSVLLRRDGEAWTMLAPSQGPAEEAAVIDLVSAVLAARWERRPDSPPPFVERRAVSLSTARGTTRVAIGDPVPATSQVWARVDDARPGLVAGWLAGALDRDERSLRATRLLPSSLGAITFLRAGDPQAGVRLSLDGRPLRVSLGSSTARASVTKAASLRGALARLRALRFDPPPGGAGLEVRLGSDGVTVRLVETGACGEGLVALHTSTLGEVCVDAAAWRAVREASLGAPEEWIETAPLAEPAVELSSPWWRLVQKGGGYVLIVDGVEHPADPEAVTELLAALSKPHRLVALAGPAGGSPVLTARFRDGQEQPLERVFSPEGRALARPGERVAMVGPGELASRTRAGWLRDRSIWTEEPMSLLRIVVRRGSQQRLIERGAVIGEWTGAPSETMAAVVPVLSALRAERVTALGGAGTVPGIELEVSFEDAAADGQRTHRLGLARAGCAAVADGISVVLDAATCAALRRLY